MAQEPTYSVTFDAARLSVGQADGTACVVCKADYLAEAQGIPSVPVGTVNGVQVFACSSHTEPAAEGKSSDWPDGEPGSVREAAEEGPVSGPEDLQRRGDEMYARLMEFALRLDAEHGSAAVTAFVDVFEVLTDGGSVDDFERDVKALRRGEVAEVRARLDE